MAKDIQSYRVLRKRKVPIIEFIEKKKNYYDVLKEHNYFYSDQKIRYRWLGKYTSKMTLENQYNDTDPEDSLPDWLKKTSNSSDEDDDIDDGESLTKVLKIELKKDLENEKQESKYTKNVLSPNKNKKTKEPQPENFKTVYVLNKPDPEPNIKCNYLLDVLGNSRDSTNTSPNYITDVQNPCHVNEIVSFPTYTIIPKKIKMNANEILKEYEIKLNLTDDSIDDVPTIEKTWPSHSVDSIQNDQSVKIMTAFPKNVYPPFSLIHLIYLAIKNSSTEYVTYQGVQQFCRNWFPYYSDKALVRIIRKTFNRYSSNFFNCEFSFSNDGSDLWTVKKKSVNALEDLLTSAVRKNEDNIKLTMRNSDKLSIIVKGYGVYNLGHDQNKITQA